MPKLVRVLFVLVLVGASWPLVTRADGDPSRLESRIVPVATLTMGYRSFLREQGPPMSPDDLNDESRPLFGAESEEAFLPVGTIDELVELVKAGVEPGFWEETEGADVQAIDEDRLLVLAPPAMQTKVASFLQDLQEDFGRTATVDLRWIAMAPDAAAGFLPSGHDPLVLGAEQAALLFARGHRGPAVSVCCFSGQLAAVTGGRQVAWIQDADVEVAQDSQTTDPIVTVSNLGFLAQVRPVLGENAVMLGVDATLARQTDERTAPTRRNGRIEVPAFQVTFVRPVLRLPYGAWAVAEGRRLEEGGPWWLLLARVTAHPYATEQGHDATVSLGVPMAPDEGSPMTFRRFSVMDLASSVSHRRGRAIFLWPSNYSPPARPQLSDPTPTFSTDQLVELLEMGLGEAAWEDPASVEARGGTLYVRNTPAALARAERAIGDLRKQATWSLVTTAEIVELPEDLDFDVGAGVLDDAARRTLAEARASGRVRTVDSLRLTNYRTARNTVRSGESIQYLQDFEVEIAQSAEIGNPVFHSAFSGAQLDLQAGRSPDGGSLQLDVDFMGTRVHRPIRTLSTTQGDVELPVMDVLRLRTGVQTPVGRTVLAGSWSEDGVRRLLLLTPRLW